MESDGAVSHGEAVSAISVSIVEDKAALRQSLAVLLGGSPGFRFLRGYRSAEEALEQLPSSPPDILLMDINLPGMNGVECVRRLKGLLPGLPVVMLTVFEEGEHVFEALRAGACGYLLKRTSPADLLSALTEVHRGGSPMSTAIARRVVESFHHAGKVPIPSASDLQRLTEREAEILKLLAEGCRNKEIADRLGVSLDTVRTHLRHVYEKLQVNSRTEALLKYLEPRPVTGRNPPPLP
jgi:DNA-binding NarL/FixJ family response regulator